MMDEPLELTEEEQLDLGKFLFHDLLGKENWEEKENEERKIIVDQVIESFRSNIAEKERKVEFCHTLDDDGKVQLAAICKPEYDSIVKAEKST